MDKTLIAVFMAPILGPIIWRILNVPGALASRIVWKYFPYGKLRSFLLRDGDPFKAAEHPADPSYHGYQKARRPKPTLGMPRR